MFFSQNTILIVFIALAHHPVPFHHIDPPNVRFKNKCHCLQRTSLHPRTYTNISVTLYQAAMVIGQPASRLHHVPWGSCRHIDGLHIPFFIFYGLGQRLHGAAPFHQSLAIAVASSHWRSHPGTFLGSRVLLAETNSRQPPSWNWFSKLIALCCVCPNVLYQHRSCPSINLSSWRKGGVGFCYAARWNSV